MDATTLRETVHDFFPKTIIVGPDLARRLLSAS